MTNFLKLHDINQLEIPDGGLFIWTSPVRANHSGLPSFVAPGLKPTNFRLKIDVVKDKLRLQTQGPQQLSWFDSAGIAITKPCHLFTEDQKYPLYFLAVPEGKEEPVTVKFRFIRTPGNWIYIFISYSH